MRARALPSDPCNMMHDNESNTTGKTGRGMNVALGATIKGKNQRAREFNKGRREY